MSLPTATKQWIVAEKPVGELSDKTFELKEVALPELKDGQILVQSKFISNDPAQRTWIQKGLDPARAYGPYVTEGEGMPCILLGTVLASKSDKFAVGDQAQGFANWSTHVVLNGEEAQNIPVIEGFSPSIALSLLGVTTMTAYVGLVDIGKVTKDDVVVVSGAAGATGSSVVQLAKNVIGCKKVIGIAGGQDKCDWVKTLGADACVDYRSATFEDDLKKATEGGVSVFFDNVGGSILNSMLAKMSRHGQVIACGAISTYNDHEVVNISNYFEVISMRITIKGFIILDYVPQFGEMVAKLTEYIKAGQISIDKAETVKPVKFEDVPNVWKQLFDGTSKQGKLVTQLEL